MPDRLHFTDDDAACELLARDPFALLVGFALDQQITVQQAFQGPLRIKQRVGTLDPKELARTDLEPAFREKPAVHRFPGTMAGRVQELAEAIASEYGGDASRIWTEAKDGAHLQKRLAALPGFGDMKVRSMLAVLAKRFGVRLEGLEEILPTHPTLGDVDSNESRRRYQEAKRAYKARMKAQQSG